MSGNREKRERGRETRTAKKPRKYNARMNGGKESEKNDEQPGYICFQIFFTYTIHAYIQYSLILANKSLLVDIA